MELQKALSKSHAEKTISPQARSKNTITAPFILLLSFLPSHKAPSRPYTPNRAPGPPPTVRIKHVNRVLLLLDQRHPGPDPLDEALPLVVGVQGSAGGLRGVTRCR